MGGERIADAPVFAGGDDPNFMYWLRLRDRSKIVYLINGVFDLLTSAHLQLLRLDNGRLGSGLVIVAIDTDKSVQYHKDHSGHQLLPLLPLEVRAATVAAIRGVDAVVPFQGDWLHNQQTSILCGLDKLIQIVRPNYLVRGLKDHDTPFPAAADFLKLGGTILFCPPPDGSIQSSSELRKSIRKKYRAEAAAELCK